MPTYEYRCPDGHEFEKFVQKISLAVSELPCPVCGKVAERQISAGGGFVFKGSGFYITDYGKDGKKDLRTNAAASASDSAKPATSDTTASPKADAPAPAVAPAGKSDAKKEKPAASPAPKSGSSDK
jgi:putative FmdB family regulatory protein